MTAAANRSMTYLLDVNALLALGFLDHSLHGRVAGWVERLKVEGSARFRLATCAITELGFVRILPQLPGFDGGVRGAQGLLTELKTSAEVEFVFIADDQEASRLPSWVKSHKQTTDGHLVELAKAHAAELATLDEAIPNSLLIPR